VVGDEPPISVRRSYDPAATDSRQGFAAVVGDLADCVALHAVEPPLPAAHPRADIVEPVDDLDERDLVGLDRRPRALGIDVRESRRLGICVEALLGEAAPAAPALTISGRAPVP